MLGRRLEFAVSKEMETYEIPWFWLTKSKKENTNQ
jgi:hypothetical protein